MRHSALLTDLYQLSMSYGYWRQGMHEQEAVFHLFFRRNPLHGDYVVASGLNQVIAFLNDFQFTSDDCDYLKSLKTPRFSADFLTYLKQLRFVGDLDAVPEGSVVFANEPLLRIRAPLILCQLLETPLINALNFSSGVATLASRIRHCVGNDVLGEFGLRRAQGPNGGLTASYAAFLGGFDATSNVLAGKHFHIPLMGTMSHSWVMAFDDELTAFRAYASVMPDNVILLLDTYDTIAGVENAIIVGTELKKRKHQLKGVRLDSGELSSLSRIVRDKLDQAGFHDTKIMVSGDLTEDRILELKSKGAPIDGWGVGTNLSTSYDQPAFDMVYKLGAIEKNGQWQYKLKRSDNRIKTSDPGVLQVKRFFDDKKWLRDIIYNEDFGVAPAELNPGEKSENLLKPIYRKGNCVYSEPALEARRQYCMDQVKQFYASKSVSYTVKKDQQLIAFKDKLMGELGD